MSELLLEAREELKRLEHIIYVTLKYTRTVDVLINALQRLVSVYDFIIEGYLEKAKEDKKIDALPRSPALRATRLAEMFPEDKVLHKFLNFYTFLKVVLNHPGKKREEFRRHVTLVVNFECSSVEVDIDNLENYERFAHKFFKYAWSQVVGGVEED